MLDVPLKGDGPFDQAWILLAWVQTSFELEQWQEVYRRAQKLDDTLRLVAVRRLGEVMYGHPQSRALSALRSAARDAARDADLPVASIPERRHSGRRLRMNREAREEAGRACGHAVLSLALAPRLEPIDVALLTSPVLATLRGMVEGPFAGRSA